MAEEVTSLRLSIDSTSAVKAEKDLNNLGKSANKLEKDVKKSTDGMNDSFSWLKKTIAGVGFASLGLEAIKTADAMNLLDGRLKLATASLEEFTSQQNSLLGIAKSSYSELKGITDLYIKLDPALKRLGATTEGVNAVTSSFAKGLQVGGAGAQESASAILQFSQAMGSGVLRGQEFNAIAEASPKLMKYMADGMGVPITSMRQLAEDGKLTADVVSIALLKMTQEIEKDFKTLPITMGKAFTNVKTDLSKLAQEFDKTSGITKSVADGLLSFSDNIYDYSGVIFTSLNDVSYVVKSSLKDISLLADEVSKLMEVFNDASKEGTGLSLFKSSLLGLKVVIDTMYVGLNNSIVMLTELAKTGKNFFEDEKLSKDFLTRVNSQILTLDDLEKKYISSYNDIAKVQEGVKKPKQEESKLDLETEIKNIEAKGKVLKAQDEQKKQAKKDEEKAQKESIKLAEDWNKRKLELAYENEIAQSDEIAKPFIQLEKKYKEDLEHFKGNKEAQLKLTENYYIEAQRLQDDAVTKFNEAEAAKAKKDQEFVNNALGLHEDATTKIIQKYTEIFDKAELFTPTQIDKLIENMNEALEKAKPELKFNASIELDPSSLDGTAKAVANIGKSMDKLGVEQKQYQENLKKAKGDSQALAKVEEDHTKSQINGYANMAGAMSNMFEQGSKEAAAFQAVESGLAVVAAVRAIMTQGTGDPYTAIPRMVAMAAMVASTLQNVGIAFGANITKTSTTYGDSVSAMSANTGTGSVLGDSKAQSESIKKSMDILEDFAQPQYSVLTQMNKYLASIDEKIGGVSSLIYQNAGYALGKGYTNTSSEKQNITFKGVDPIPFMNNIIAKIPIVNIVADLFGGVVNSILGGLFGKKSISQSITDSGLYFADTFLKSAVEGIYGQAYQTISTTVTKKSWFSKSSSTTVNTYFQELDAETNRQFSLVLDNLYQTTLLSGKALDTSSADVANSLSNFIVSIGKISLLGKTGDQIKEELEAVFGRVGDSIAQTAFPMLTQFQAVGEGLFETMTRVATGMEEAGYYINRLGKDFTDVKYTDIINKQGNVGFEALLQSIIATDEAVYGLSNSVVEMLDNLDGTAEELYTAYKAFGTLRLQLSATGKDITYLTSAMIAGAGGMSELNSGLSDYIENFMTSSEQLAYNTSVMRAEFDAAGVVMPTTKEAFRSLVESIDITSESGQDLYGRIIALSGGFADLMDNGVNKWLSAMESINEAMNNLNPTFKTFTELANSTIGLDNYSTLLSDLERTRQNEISKLNEASNLRITQLNKEKSYFQAILDYVEELTKKMTLQTDTLSTFFYNELQTAKDNFAQNKEVDISGLSSSASTYLDSVKENSATQRDYFFEVAKVRNELSEFGESLAEGGSLESIEAAIAKEESTLATKLDAINQTALSILNGYKTTATNNITSDQTTQTYKDVLGIYTSLGLNQYQTDTSGYQYWANQVNSGNIAPSQLKNAIKTSAEQILGKTIGFSSGGYTGNVPVNNIAGVVHGQEYVINAPTTRDLGLNGSGGVFREMNNELRSLREENSTMKNLMVKLVATNTNQLSTQRAILGERVL